MKLKGYLFVIPALILLLIWGFTLTYGTKDKSLEKVRVVLRDAGHQLLLSGNDSTSLVLPIKKTDETSYELSFEQPFSFEPDSLVAILDRCIQGKALSDDYFVEVLDCQQQNVVYSYESSAKAGESIIPCRGRAYPEDCYIFNLSFISNGGFSNRAVIWILPVAILLLIAFGVFGLKKKQPEVSENTIDSEGISIGRFRFFPEQNKLIKSSEEISLSNKECDLLAIFITQPNQIVKREELTKRVWEDNGVIVGRSLDTYISKLRKKLRADESVKLTNVHGVGYKLEMP